MLDLMLYYNINLTYWNFFCETFSIVDHSEVHQKKKKVHNFLINDFALIFLYDIDWKASFPCFLDTVIFLFAVLFYKSWSLCLLFFIKFLFFHQMNMKNENYEKCFLFHQKKPFSFLRYINFCTVSPLFRQFPDSKEQMEVEYIMMSSIDLHKFADVIFGISQKLLYITSSNLVR